VAAMTVRPEAEGLNAYLSTPNKLFESLAAGVPVVTSDIPERRRIVMEDPAGPLGVVCDPTDPAAVAEAIRSIINLDAHDRENLRRRCLLAAHERWNWETESKTLLAFYDELAESQP
jgi:glycosyltransferase involved in cell wall biosynthesis